MNRAERRAAARRKTQARPIHRLPAADRPRPDEVHRAFSPLDDLLDQLLKTGEMPLANDQVIMRGPEVGIWVVAVDGIEGWCDFWERVALRLDLAPIDVAPLRQFIAALRDDTPVDHALIHACQAVQAQLRARYRTLNVFAVRDIVHEQELVDQLAIPSQ